MRIMKYMGSKSRIAKDIVPIIQKYIDDNNISTYYEPFVGAANIIDKIRCGKRIGSDLNKYLIALLIHVQKDLPLYESVSKELYDKARTAFNNGDTSEFEDWQIGNIMFLASYNGRDFSGGYAKTGYEKTKNGLRLRNYYQEAKNNLMEQAPNLKDIDFSSENYIDFNNKNKELKNAVIYIDPPYENTKQYANATNFDYIEFWNIMRELSKNNIVLISELKAPEDFECIWEQKVRRSIKVDNKSKVTEKLFVLKKE